MGVSAMTALGSIRRAGSPGTVITLLSARRRVANRGGRSAMALLRESTDERVLRA
jgi:hypothetical protein